jgi:hypothetical protein
LPPVSFQKKALKRTTSPSKTEAFPGVSYAGAFCKGGKAVARPHPKGVDGSGGNGEVLPAHIFIDGWSETR